MKRNLTVTLLILLFFVLDNVLIPFLSIKGYIPSLLLVFCISYAINNGRWEGLWIGVVAGILQDIFFFNGFGINALANMLICILAGEVGRNIFKDKALIPVISTFVLSLIKGIIVYTILYLSHQYTRGRIILYSSLYNMFISIFMYPYVYKLCRKDFMKKDWKF